MKQEINASDTLQMLLSAGKYNCINSFLVEELEGKLPILSQIEAYQTFLSPLNQEVKVKQAICSLVQNKKIAFYNCGNGSEIVPIIFTETNPLCSQILADYRLTVLEKDSDMQGKSYEKTK